MTGTKHWKIEVHIPRAIDVLENHNFRSTLQLGRDLSIHGRMAAAIFKRLGWLRWSGKTGSNRGVVYMRPDKENEQ